MSNELQLSIVLPCLNEAETVSGCVQQSVKALADLHLNGEVIVADNNSSDRSGLLAAQAGARLVSVQKRGYGAALMAGIEEARGTYVLIGDSDGSYDFGEAGRFFEKLNAGFDVVIGCRFPSGGGKIYPGAMPMTHRWLGTPFISLLGRLLYGIKVADFNCGLRAFKKEAIQSLGLESTGMEFASELIVKARLKNLKIGQVPCSLRPDGRSHPPHLRPFQDGWRHIKTLFKFSFLNR